MASELSHNLRLIIKSLDNKESSELWRGAKSNLQIFEMLKKGTQSLPENFKMGPFNPSEAIQLSPEELKAFMRSDLKSAPQTKKESIYPEFREQTELDAIPAKPLKYSDPNRKIHVVGSQSDGVVS